MVIVFFLIILYLY